MRKIKFRAWDKKDRMMISWETMDCDGRWARLQDVFNDINFEFLQFTGLKDKNGKEIYEGDIISCRDGKAEIIYIDSFAKFVMDFNLSGSNALIDLEEGNYQDADTCMRSIEVLGNRYENPELLTSSENSSECEPNQSQLSAVQVGEKGCNTSADIKLSEGKENGK